MCLTGNSISASVERCIGCSRPPGKALAPVARVAEQGSLLALRKPKIGERCHVRCPEPMSFPVSVHGPPLSGFRSGFPVNTVVHKRPLGDDNTFKPAQIRIFLRVLIHLDYSFLEEVATDFVNGYENAQQSDDEIVLAALHGMADEKLIVAGWLHATQLPWCFRLQDRQPGRGACNRTQGSARWRCCARRHKTI